MSLADFLIDFDGFVDFGVFAFFSARFFWRRRRRFVAVRSKYAAVVVVSGAAGNTLGSVAGASVILFGTLGSVASAV